MVWPNSLVINKWSSLPHPCPVEMVFGYSFYNWSVSCSVKSNCLWPHGLWSWFVTRFVTWSWFVTSLLCLWNSPGKNTGVGSHVLLQGIFLTQGSNPGLPHCRHILYHPRHQGNPSITELSSKKWYIGDRLTVKCLENAGFQHELYFLLFR